MESLVDAIGSEQDYIVPRAGYFLELRPVGAAFPPWN